MSPYTQTTFFEFLVLFFKRLFLIITTQLPLDQIASDEVQIFSLCLIAIMGGVLGTLLVVRKMTMLANALSHTVLLGIVGVYLLLGKAIYLNALFLSAIVVALVTTFLVQFLQRRFKLYEDATIGYVFTTLFAIGIVLVTLFTKNVHIGLESVMGNLDGMHIDDLKRLFVLCGINVAITVVFFKEFKLTSFDPNFAKTLGLSLAFFNYLLMAQVALCCMGAFRAVGVVLVLSFLCGPTLLAIEAKNLKKVMFKASLYGCIISIFSVALSRHLLTFYDLPVSTAGLCTTVMFICVLAHFGFKKKAIHTSF
jgi:manganese/zinc/iron transport system permease protein